MGKIYIYRYVLIKGLRGALRWAIGLALVPAALWGQTRSLTLDEAVALAREHNPRLAATRARADAARSGGEAAAAFLWPSLHLAGGITATDDPVGVFGGKLRQGTFGEADFAIDRLVDPDGLTDWSGAVSASWEILDGRRWAELSAANALTAAAEASAARATEATDYRTRLLYVGALEAEAAERAAVAARDAAGATAAFLASRHGEGLLTEADALRGRAELAGEEARLVAAREAVAHARRALAAQLGLGPGVAVEPRGALEPPAAPGGDDGRFERADLAAAERAVAAADAAVRAARLARLPTLSAFGRLAHHAGDPFGDGGAYLVGGVEVRLPVFTGFATRAEIQRARALRSAAAHELAALELDARLEVESARGRLAAAREGWGAARTAAESAHEALRLVRRRFEEGMATTSDLLAAQSSAATHEAAEVAALAALHRAIHTLTFVTGSAPAPSAAAAQRRGGAP